MVDMRIKLSGMELDNPIIPASGTFGYGKEFADLYDINMLGSFSFKGTTLHERFGNNQPRIADCREGLINSVGLQNPGIHKVVKEELADIGQIFKKKVIANISGFALEEYVECTEALNEQEQVGIIEINISCPNVKGGGLAFGQDPKEAEKITKAVKKVSKKPVYIKLSPNVTDIREIAKACESAGADGLSLINTLLGMRIDIQNKKPILANKVGGFSGPAIFPIALRMVYETSQVVKIPIMGVGGIKDEDDVIEMIMAGATAVQVGSENLVNPFVCKEIIERLPKLMEKLKINSFEEIRGVAWKEM